MKVYLFYKKDPISRKEKLYAYTDDTSLAKYFRKDRDPNIIRMETERGWSYDEFKKLKSSHPGKALHIAPFTTKSQIGCIQVKAEVVCTWDEEARVINEYDNIMDMLAKITFDPMILAEEYREPLSMLLFNFFNNFCSIRKNIYYDYTMEGLLTSNFENVDVMLFEEYRDMYFFDELAMFVHVFSDTFKDKL